MEPSQDVLATRQDTVTINGCELTVRRLGLRHGRDGALLWLHGTDGLTEWPALIDRLAERRQVIVPEHPGFGATPVPGWMDDVSDLAYLYMGLIAELDLPRVHLAGHSLGGWIGAEIAVRSTAALGRLALITPAGIHVKGSPKTDVFMIDPDEQARLSYHDPAMAEAAALRALAAKYQESAVANRVAAARFGWNPRFFNPRLERWLGRIDIPTLIVWGREDRIFPVSHAKGFHKAIPGSRIAILDETGHLPHVERLEETAALIEGLLA